MRWRRNSDERLLIRVHPAASGGDELLGARLELVEVAGVAGPPGTAPEHPLVDEPGGQRESPDPDLHRPGPVLVRDVPLDDAGRQTCDPAADDDREEGAAVFGERLSPGAPSRRDP